MQYAIFSMSYLLNLAPMPEGEGTGRWCSSAWLVRLTLV